MKNISFRLFFAFFCLFLTGNAFLYAQSTAAEIERLLSDPAVTYAQAARFLLDTSGKLTTYDQSEAFQYAMDRGWLPAGAEENQQARLDGVSKLLMNSFDIKGGLFYSLTKSPHYAYRELVYRDYIQGRTSPGMDVSGRLLLFITGRVLTDYEKKIPVEDNSVMEEQVRLERELAAANAAREEQLRRERELAEENAAREEQARLERELAEEDSAREEQLHRERELAAEDAAREEQTRLERDLAWENAEREEQLHLERELAAANAAREEQARLERDLVEENARREEATRLTAEILNINFPYILFEQDSSELTEAEIEKLREIINTLKNIPNVRLHISGHDAMTGSRQARNRIAQERAQVIASYLVSQGACRAENITTAGYGSNRPVASNLTDAGMAANRRVEITITGVR